MSAPVSSHPNALAPSSHSALLLTPAPPPPSVQRPTLRSMNPANRPSLLHAFSAAMQYIPLVLVQAVFPQMHGKLSSALLGMDPSVFLQAWAVSVHMHT